MLAFHEDLRTEMEKQALEGDGAAGTRGRDRDFV